jgi:adenylate cyclase
MDRQHLKRRLTAVMIADVVGYSRLMSVDEESTHLRLSDHIKNSIEPKISEQGGRLVRTAGDGLLVEFDSAVTRCIVRSISSINWQSWVLGSLPIGAFGFASA